MLGSVSRDLPAQPPERSSKELASGIAAELRAELGALDSGKPSSDIKAAELERVLNSLESTLAASLKASPRPTRPSELIDTTVSNINRLSPTAQALLRGVSRAHIDLDEYKEIMKGPFADALQELRSSGLIVPLQHKKDGKPVPCYWFPGEMAPIVRTAMAFLPKPEPEVRKRINSELKRVGYAFPGDDEGAG